MTLDQLIPVLQVAVGPAILISAVGLLLLTHVPRRDIRLSAVAETGR
jgi:hypothetical protein